MELLDALILRLSAKGLMPVKVLQIIDDSLNIVREGGIFSLKMLNKKLRNKGWEENMLDDSTYDLVMLCFADSDNYVMKKMSITRN